jgi:bacteriorhodopsin
MQKPPNIMSFSVSKVSLAIGRMVEDMSAGQFDLVYNVLSFSLASMAASTMFFWLRVSSVNEKYKSALVISGLVTFIAAYHYFRIFNSWTEAYKFSESGALEKTGKPFNDAYRYMDWLLTVPLLLLEIIFCMNLTPKESSAKAWVLGIASALMIAVGYPGEPIIEGDQLWIRAVCFVFSFLVFLYIVYELLVGLSGAIAKETNSEVASMLRQVCVATVISWCTYPVVYLFPFFGISGAEAVIGIQCGYCVSDVISKCGVGFLIYNITIKKSAIADTLLPK